MARNYEKEISLCLWVAQKASDEAKVSYHKDALYALKVKYQMKAMNLISRSHSKVFRYSVQSGKLDWRCTLTYFDVRAPWGERCQVSFHGYSSVLDERAAFNKNLSHWDKSIGGSRETCDKLVNFYNVRGQAEKCFFKEAWYL